MSLKPKIFVFCNGCSDELGGMHNAIAVSEDGHVLAGHCCSNHYWIRHDMGLTSDWKHEEYRKHYPDGFDLEFVDLEASRVMEHEGVKAAHARHLENRKESA